MEWPQYERSYALESGNWWFVGRKVVAQAVLRQWVSPGAGLRILDVGCGTGGNLAWLSEEGQVYGLDISPTALFFARQRSPLRLLMASGGAIPYPDDSFDLVTGFDVLYHQWVADDRQAVAEFSRVLKSAGWLLVTDSALPALWSSHDEAYYARQRYTVATIRSTLTGAGFEVRLCSYTNFLLLPAFVVFRLVLPILLRVNSLNQWQQLPVWLNGLLAQVRSLEKWWLLRGYSLPVGSSLICLAQWNDRERPL
jgi:SAM-dependent methyltransferase